MSEEILHALKTEIALLRQEMGHVKGDHENFKDDVKKEIGYFRRGVLVILFATAGIIGQQILKLVFIP